MTKQTSLILKTILLLTVLFTAFGFLLISNSSLIEAQTKFGDSFFYIKKHSQWVGLSILMLLFVQLLPQALFIKLAKPFYYLCLCLLLLLFVQGFSQSILGARRWLTFGPLTFQPAELTKIALLLYLPQVLLKSKDNAIIKNFLTVVVPPILLVIAQPDMGTAMVLAGIAFCLLFLTHAPLKQFTALGICLVLASIFFISISPYRVSRVRSMLDPERDPLGHSYHSYQITLSLGMGGLFGQGLGNSRQKYQYLPQITTDSILAIFAEEFGYLGVVLFVIVFIYFLSQFFLLAKLQPDPYKAMVVAGYASILGMQGFINLGSIAIILPLTGIPFPFVSYGGTLFFILFFGLALVIKFTREKL